MNNYKCNIGLVTQILHW